MNHYFDDDANSTLCGHAGVYGETMSCNFDVTCPTCIEKMPAAETEDEALDDLYGLTTKEYLLWIYIEQDEWELSGPYTEGSKYCSQCGDEPWSIRSRVTNRHLCISCFTQYLEIHFELSMKWRNR
jgi:hypothetical protein